MQGVGASGCLCMGDPKGLEAGAEGETYGATVAKSCQE